MPRCSINGRLATILSVALGIPFLLAGAIKCFGAAFGMLPTNTMLHEVTGGSNALIVGLGTVELLLGVWLLTRFMRLGAALVSLVLCSTFFGLVLRETTKPIPKSCGCFTLQLSDSPQGASSGSLAVAIARVSFMTTASILLVFTRLQHGVKETADVQVRLAAV